MKKGETSMNMKSYMRIKELSEKSGVPKSTIHFYLREGLLHPPAKTGKTMAYYDQSHLQRLATIKRLKKEYRLPIAFLKEELAQMGEKTAQEQSKESKDESTTSPKDIRKAEIVKAAIDVFSKKGYHRAKVKDITSKVGISTGTFYIYFENKRELFIEVVEDVFRHIVGDAAESIKKEDDLGRRLVIRGQTFFQNYTRYMEILNQLRAEIASDEDWPREKFNRMYMSLTGPVIREACKAIEMGEIREGVDPELMAFALTGLIEVLSFRVSLDDKYNIEDAMRFIGEMMIHGLLSKQNQDNGDIDQLL